MTDRTKTGLKKVTHLLSATGAKLACAANRIAYCYPSVIDASWDSVPFEDRCPDCQALSVEN